MAWQRTPPSLIAAFERLLPDDPRIERRKMFGLPCAFLGGNMFAGVHESNLILRLSEPDRERAKAEVGAAAFAPMGRAMKEYVAVAEAAAADTERLRPWLERSLAFAAALPPKPKKPASGKRKAR